MTLTFTTNTKMLEKIWKKQNLFEIRSQKINSKQRITWKIKVPGTEFSIKEVAKTAIFKKKQLKAQENANKQELKSRLCKKEYKAIITKMQNDIEKQRNMLITAKEKLGEKKVTAKEGINKRTR